MKELSNEAFEEILSYQDMISPAARNPLGKGIPEGHGVSDIMQDRRFIEFWDALNYTGFMERFDYIDWMNKRDDFDITDTEHAVEQINRADLDEIRKMMTVYIRTERFAEGHMQQLYEKGFFDRFFDRVKEPQLFDYIRRTKAWLILPASSNRQGLAGIMQSNFNFNPAGTNPGYTLYLSHHLNSCHSGLR